MKNQKTINSSVRYLLLLFIVGFCQLSMAKANNTSETITPIKDGDKCPEIQLVDSVGNSHALSSLKGKYVLIDVWASWCYPCRKQFPALADLEKKLEKKNIVFLGISTDTQSFRWMGALNYSNVPGSNQWWDSKGELTKLFQVDYIPRFILLDPKGKVVKAKMTLPSDPATYEYLSKLLK